MKKNIFSKISVFVLMLCSVMVLSACSLFQKDGENITGIDVIDETVPNYILAESGAFDEAGIKIKVSYSDESYRDVTVTTQMIPEEYRDELLTPGEYDITILFKGHETVLHIKIAEVENVFTVRFFNAYNNLISVQEIKEGENAVAPNAGLYAVDGFTFMGWDRAITNVTEDMDVYATYINVENTLTEKVLEEKFYDAINYTMTTSHTSSYQDLSDEGWEELYLNNFHYDKETGDVELQQKSYCAGEIMGYTEVKNGYGIHVFSDDSEEGVGCVELDKSATYLFAEIYSIERVNNIMQDEEGTVVEYSYLIAGNKTAYYCTISQDEYSKYVFAYDDEKMLSCKYYGYDYHLQGERLSVQVDYVYSETEVPFEDWSDIITEDPEEIVNQAKIDVVEAYNNTVASDMIIVFNESSRPNSMKYDKDNKVSAEYTYEGTLVNVKWEDGTTANNYDGTSYSTIDGILSFIPNIAEIVSTGKLNGEDIIISVEKDYNGEEAGMSFIWIDTEYDELLITIENGKIVGLEVYVDEGNSSYKFTYENVELTLSEDIKNKVEGAELAVNN